MKRQTGNVIRYAGDWVVVCPTKERAEMARTVAEAALARLGLRLHPDKTRIVNLTKGAQGLDFLGFHLLMYRSPKRPDRYYLLRWPSKRAMASIKAKVRQMTDRRYVGLSLETAVARLNPVLRGWAGYFRHGNSSRKFQAINSYVHQRMAILASNKHGLHGRYWATRFTYGWFMSLGIYRLAGVVHYKSAYALRRTVSESRVLENGMRGLKGGRWGQRGDHVGDAKKDQSDDPSLGHRQSPMYSIAQPAAYLTWWSP